MDPDPVIELRQPEVDAIIPAGDVSLHYLGWGDANLNRPTVVFLHGVGLTAHTWDVACTLLSPHFPCLAVDLRGHGDSDWSADGTYDLTRHVGDVEAFASRLGLTRFVLVGMSLGGSVALSYAAREGHRLLGLVLVDTNPLARPDAGTAIREFIADTTELDTLEAFVERAVSFNPRRRPELLRRSLLNNLRRTPSGKWTWKYDPRALSNLTVEQRAARTATLWRAVESVSCPALVIRGSESDVMPDEDAERLAQALPLGRRVTIEGAGHTVQGDRPVALAEELRLFLEGLATP